MYIIPISSSITPIESVERMLAEREPVQETEEAEKEPSFLDVFSGIVNNAIKTTEQKNSDVYDLMLGEDISIEQLQINMTKAQIATELLVNVKNAVVDSYNEIIRMSI